MENNTDKNQPSPDSLGDLDVSDDISIQEEITVTQFPPDDTVRWIRARGMSMRWPWIAMCLAIAMSTHKRLGEESALGSLLGEILQFIAILVSGYIPDLPFAHLVDEILFEFLQEHGFGLNYNLDDEAGAELNIVIGKGQYIRILDNGPFDIDSDAESFDSILLEDEKNARLYEDRQAIRTFDIGSVRVLAKSRIFQRYMDEGPERELSDTGRNILNITLQNLDNEETIFDFTLIDFEEEAAFYESSALRLPEETDKIKELMKILVDIALPSIYEHRDSLPSNASQALPAEAFPDEDLPKCANPACSNRIGMGAMADALCTACYRMRAGEH